VVLRLVTGGNGFIGRHLVRLLRDRGDRVRVVDLDGGAPPMDGVEQIVGDIRDADVMRRATDGAAVVHHLAAIPDLWRRDTDDFTSVNVEGTRIVLDAARAAGVRRIVVASTESILKSWRGSGPPGIGDAFDRLSPADVPGAYCRSKLAADRLVSQAARAGAPVVIMHPTMPIGPGDRRLTPPTAMILGFLRRRHPAYYDAAFNLVDARDAAAGFVAAEATPPGSRFILAGENIRLGALLRRLEAMTGIAMPRLRLPYGAALGYAAVVETWATLVSRQPPPATVAGVRLVRTPLSFDSAESWRALGLEPRALTDSLGDLIADLTSRALVTSGNARRLLSS
jgi:dihydroflavonol-4-reductase